MSKVNARSTLTASPAFHLRRPSTPALYNAHVCAGKNLYDQRFPYISSCSGVRLFGERSCAVYGVLASCIRGAVACGCPRMLVRVSRRARYADVASVGCAVVPGCRCGESVFRGVGLNGAFPHRAARHLCRSAFVRPVLGRYVRVGVPVVRGVFRLHGFRELACAVRKRRARRYAHGLAGFALGAAIRFARSRHRRRARRHERCGAPFEKRRRAGAHAHRERAHGVGHGRRPGAKLRHASTRLRLRRAAHDVCPFSYGRI